MQKTIIISNRLPITVEKEDDQLKFSPSAGGLATGLGSIYKQGNNLWLGWPGFHDFEESEQANITTQLNFDDLTASGSDIQKSFNQAVE